LIKRVDECPKPVDHHRYNQGREMKLSPVVQQTIDIFKETEKTKLDIATAILAKQQDATKKQGQAAVQLIEQAAVPSRGIDVRA
jgi:hypothetical protein